MINVVFDYETLHDDAGYLHQLDIPGCAVPAIGDIIDFNDDSFFEYREFGTSYKVTKRTIVSSRMDGCTDCFYIICAVEPCEI